jgi:hypothetical protein
LTNFFYYLQLDYMRTNSVLRSGPVRSFGFFGQDRNRNRLPKTAGSQKPDRNRHGPVATGLGRSFAVAQPVATGGDQSLPVQYRLQPVFRGQIYVLTTTVHGPVQVSPCLIKEKKTL